MSKSKSFVLGLLCVIPVFSICQEPKGPVDNLQYVDPRIGNVGWLLVPTRPTAQVPNQMIRMYPERADHLDDQITGFPLTVAAHRNGNLFGIMPVSGEIDLTKNPISAWDSQLEITRPNYYFTWLEDYDVKVEFAPGKKAGFFRFSFPEGKSKYLLLKNLSKNPWKTSDGKTFESVEFFQGMKAFGIAQIQTSQNEIPENKVNETGTWLSFKNKKAGTIAFKYAISYISPEQAKKNLETEIPEWDFEGLKSQAKTAWDKELNRIDTEGGTTAQRRSFYTALYRCYERMVNITEDGKYYSGYDHKIHEDAQTFYADDWSWDTYLAHHPLRCILNPDREADMAASYVRMYDQSGWMPTFPQVFGDLDCMNGFHSSAILLDDYRKGIRNFDVIKAYKGMKNNEEHGTMVPWRNGPACSLDTFYREHGYFPALSPGEKETVSRVHPFERRQAVAVTLGNSFDSWASAQMAAELGEKSDYEKFMKKSGNYKNLYRADKGFFMPKDASGKWIDIDPSWDGGPGGRDYYDENNGWTYLWQVQQDILGLISLMGGKTNFENRLDQLFREGLGRSKYENWAKFPDFTGIVGQYSMGNEPSFHILYLYNFTDSPWKTQKRVRMLLDTWFKDNIFGIPGDEDGGGMSAFVVFSSMGFYPVIPGLPIYTIGSPVFSKTTIHLDNGKDFTILAPGCSETNKYIQEAFLNGKPLNGPWFAHQDILTGGELKLVMGAYPNKNWGTDSTLFGKLDKEYSK
jgi:predicted alpha-1,2-mannosidase